METEVVMQRELFGGLIAQKSKSEFFSATDLVKAGNRWRMSQGMMPFNLAQWLKTKSTREFITELENKFGKAYIASRGRGGNTWVHPLLFIDIALAISPKLKIEVYGWLFDHLLRYRNESGDSYKLMCGAFWIRHGNKRTFSDYIQGVALRIKECCGVEDWEAATVEQLEKRNEIHKNIALLADVMNNNDEAVRIAIEKMAHSIVDSEKLSDNNSIGSGKQKSSGKSFPGATSKSGGNFSLFGGVE